MDFGNDILPSNPSALSIHRPTRTPQPTPVNLAYHSLPSIPLNTQAPLAKQEPLPLHVLPSHINPPFSAFPRPLEGLPENNLPPFHAPTDSTPLITISQKTTENRKKKAQKRSRKRKANAQASTSDPKKLMSEAEAMEQKRKQRLVRNRASAQLSRDRKKVHLTNLENQVLALAEENTALKSQVAKLTSEINHLRQQNSFGSPIYQSPASDYGSEDSTGTFSSGSASPGHLSSGLFLFAFVFAFGVFFQWSGLDLGGAPPSHAMASSGGRALQSYQSAPLLDWSVVPSFKSLDQSKDNDVLGITALAREESPKELESAVSQLIAKTDNMALSVSPYQAPNQDSYIDSTGLYEKLLWANETIEANVSYFFVPSLYSIFDSHPGNVHSYESSDPPPKVAGYLSDADVTQRKPFRLIDNISPGDHLSLWLPTATQSLEDLTAHSYDTNPHRKAQAQRDPTMYQIGCQVEGAVRALPFTLFKS